MKKRGFGVGKWNGYGGKLDEGESIEQCAIRELEEECSIVSHNMVRKGRYRIRYVILFSEYCFL
jgi:8-oxo-dGTP pyrophosphatase MutT (NUDIX family)